jgi:hypothetical protein
MQTMALWKRVLILLFCGWGILAATPNLFYAQVPDQVLLEGLVSLRSINVGLLRALPNEGWLQTVMHPEAGDQSVEQISTMFGDHIADHRNDLQNAGLNGARR